MKCPRCQTSDLKPEMYESVEIDRCADCHGSWLDDGELIKIIKTKEEIISKKVIGDTLTSAFSGVSIDEQQSVEKCPKCPKAMTPINYNYSSGVVIDRCPDNHGVWLDGKELEKVQAHAEHWEKEASANEGGWVELVEAVDKGKKDAADESSKRKMGPTKYVVSSLMKIFSDL
jgi:Zn-finger nucleic acid-binding protein